MVQQYTIMGRQIGAHWLSMATLGTVFGGSYLAMRGKKPKEQGPAINATSKEEEDFINQFIKNAEAEEKKAKQ